MIVITGYRIKGLCKIQKWWIWKNVSNVNHIFSCKVALELLFICHEVALKCLNFLKGFFHALDAQKDILIKTILTFFWPMTFCGHIFGSPNLVHWPQKCSWYKLVYCTLLTVFYFIYLQQKVQLLLENPKILLTQFFFILLVMIHSIHHHYRHYNWAYYHLLWYLGNFNIMKILIRKITFAKKTTKKHLGNHQDLKSGMP